MATRSAPNVNGVPTYEAVSIRLIDASGDLRTVTLQSEGTLTAAEVQSYVDAFQAITNASIYEVQVNDVYWSKPTKSLATDAPKDSVFDNIVILAKASPLLAQNGFVPAPVSGVFVDGTDNPDLADTALQTFATELLSVLNGGALGSGTYDIFQYRYSERSEINTAVKA